LAPGKKNGAEDFIKITLQMKEK